MACSRVEVKLATVHRAEKATVALNTSLREQRATINTMAVFSQFSLSAVLTNVKIKLVVCEAAEELQLHG